MASYEDLKDAIRHSLRERGVLRRVQAELRQEAFCALNSAATSGVRREPSPETVIVNELVMEYLRFNGYHFTASAFQAEAAHPQGSADRAELRKALMLSEDEPSRNVPLLYPLALRHVCGTSTPFDNVRLDGDQVAHGQNSKPDAAERVSQVRQRVWQ